MKNYYGEPIQGYFEKEKRGKLTGTYGGGQVRTDSITLSKGVYVVSVSCKSDTSSGNKLTTGDYQGRVQTDKGVLVESCHTGNGAYDLSFSASGIVNLESETSVYAVAQTGSSHAVNGGVRVVLRAVKVN